MLRLLGTTFCTSEQHLKAAASCQQQTALRKIHVLSHCEKHTVLAPSSRHLIDKSKLREKKNTVPHYKTNLQREGEKNSIELTQSRDLSNATTRTSERSLPLFLVLSLPLLSLLSLAFFVKRARGDVLALVIWLARESPELHIKKWNCAVSANYLLLKQLVAFQRGKGLSVGTYNIGLLMA